MSPIALVLVVILILVVFGGGYGYRSGNNFLARGWRTTRVDPGDPPSSVPFGPYIAVIEFSSKSIRRR